MPEPTSHAVAVAVATPTVAAAATLFEISLWPFALAFAFAFGALLYQEVKNPLRAVAVVIFSTAAGGTLAQLSAIPALIIVVKFVPELQPWAANARFEMTALLAIGIGVFAHKLVPALLRRTDRLGNAS